MLPWRRINFLLSILVSLKSSWQQLIGFSEFFGLKSVQSSSHHSNAISNVHLNLEMICSVISTRALQRDLWWGAPSRYWSSPVCDHNALAEKGLSFKQVWIVVGISEKRSKLRIISAKHFRGEWMSLAIQENNKHHRPSEPCKYKCSGQR